MSVITKEGLILGAVGFFAIVGVLSILLTVTVLSNDIYGRDPSVGVSLNPLDYAHFFISLMAFQVPNVHPLVVVFLYLPWGAVAIGVISLLRG